jgi:hypothetical protein
MPDETAQEAPPTTEAPAPSAPDAAEGEDGKADGNEWLRETAQGLIYSRPLDTAKQSDEWAEANAELRRGRKGTPKGEGEGTRPEGEGGEKPDAQPDEAGSSPREGDDRDFDRRVQAEVDRREAVRRQRADQQNEQRLRRENPQEYARLKEEQESASQRAGALSGALKQLAEQFDDASIRPLMEELPEATRTAVLQKAANVHGLEQRKLLAREGITALKKAAYDEGYAKGKESAQKTLRRSSTFRNELLSELRGEEDEPDVALANGKAGGSGGSADWDMNDWMRSMTGRSTRRQSRE